MEKYLLDNKNDEFIDLEKVKDILSKTKSLEYLYKYETDNSKSNFEYALLIHELATKFPFVLKAKSWLNICCSPGDYDNYLHYFLKNAKGSGVTLSPEKGGMKFIYDIPGYKLYYHDIINEQFHLPDKYDLIITGCLNMNLKNKKMKDNDLIAHSFIHGFKYLNPGGTFLFKTTTKNIEILAQYYYWMHNSFEKIYSYKSPHILTHRSMFYIVGQGYRGGSPDLKSILKEDFSYIEPVVEKIMPYMEDIFTQQTYVIYKLLDDMIYKRMHKYHYDNDKSFWIHYTQDRNIPSLESEYEFYQEYNKKPLQLLIDYMTKYKWNTSTTDTTPTELIEFPKEHEKKPKNMLIRYSIFPMKFHDRVLLPINFLSFLHYNGYLEIFTTCITHQLPSYSGLFYDLESFYGSLDINDPTTDGYFVNIPMISREFTRFMIRLLEVLHYRKKKPIVIINGFPTRMNIAVKHTTLECRGEFIEQNLWTNSDNTMHSTVQLIVLGEIPEVDLEFMRFCIKTNKIITTKHIV